MTNSTHDAMHAMVVLTIHRGVGDGPTYTEQYELSPENTHSLLDGLRWIHRNVDDSLAFRYSCINANACQECMLELDGEVVYACMERLKPGHRYNVKPLSHKARFRDLITQIAPAKEQLQTSYQNPDTTATDDKA